MRSAELGQQAHAILECLERQLRAQGYHFGWHQRQCLIVAQTHGQAQKARQMVDQLLRKLAGGFIASKAEIKALPNGYLALEFTLVTRRAARHRRRRSTLPDQRTSGCVLRK